MHALVRLLHNGTTIVGSENRSWELLTDGELDIPLPPGIWRQLAEFDGSAQLVQVRVSLRGYPTVEEVSRRLDAAEVRLRELEAERWELTRMSLAADVGLIVPMQPAMTAHRARPSFDFQSWQVWNR